MAFRKKISFLGIITGATIVVIGTNIWSFLILLLVLFLLLFGQLTPSSHYLWNGVIRLLNLGDRFFPINLIVGSLFSILGGYIAAHIAKHDEILNAALSSFLYIILGIITVIICCRSASFFLLFLINPILTMSGGFLRLKQPQRRVKNSLAE